MSASAGNTSTRNTIIFGAIGVVVLSVIGFLGYQNYNLTNDKEEFEYQIEDLNVEILDLEEDLLDLESEINNKDLELEDKDRMLAEKEMELKDKQKMIQKLLSSNRINKEQAADLMGKIEQLDYYIKKYQVEIDDLKAKVGTLQHEKEELKGSVNKLEEEKFTLEQSNMDKQTKLDAAAILKAYNIETFMVKSSGKIIPKDEIRAGRLKDLQICFNLMENLVARKEAKWIYVVMDDPEGKTVTDMTSQSGYFEFLDTEKEYTVKKQIEFKGVSENLCVNYKKLDNQEFVKGDYTIRVYADGYEIGRGKLAVK